jgi:small GTP-binding protein
MTQKTRTGNSSRKDKGSQAPSTSGVKLLRTLRGHGRTVRGVAIAPSGLLLAIDPSGLLLASGSADRTVMLWDIQTGELLRTLEGHKDYVWTVAFHPDGRLLASGGHDGAVKVWDPQTGKLVRTLDRGPRTTAETGWILSMAFDPRGEILATGSTDGIVRLWDPSNGTLLGSLYNKSSVRSVAFDPQGRTLVAGNNQGGVQYWDLQTRGLLRAFKGDSEINRVTFDPDGTTLATAGGDGIVNLWEAHSGKLLRVLEGHTASIDDICYSRDGRLLASKSADGTVRIWSCASWETVAVLDDPHDGGWNPALAFHPSRPLLVSASSDDQIEGRTESYLIHLRELDYEALFGAHVEKQIASTVHHTTGKIVLVGDHSVGKSALGYRLIHGAFKEQASSHGQQFWVFPALGKRRGDGTECEAILWDLAGQPDYRLVHALFVDNADLALVLFDASDLRDPLHGVGFWLKQLQTEHRRCPIILVAAQSDRGTSPLTRDELSAFCQKHSLVGPITTSAFTGQGVAELVDRMKSLIPWEDKAATVTTTTFKRIKDYILGLKAAESRDMAIVTPEVLADHLKATDADWEFTDAEMLTAVGHLENYGYVKRLRTSKGEVRILLQPERLNNLASSLVLEARRNPKGLGALEEKRLLADGYGFSELKELGKDERDVLLDSAALLFLEHNVCFRETDPKDADPMLVFPELINLKKPIEEEAAIQDGVAYTVTGPTKNVFASLVVRLGYTHTFTRTSQWQNNARYEVGDGFVCGFRLEAERDGELDFVLCFAPKVDAHTRTLFQAMFESFLAPRNVTVMRYEPVRCDCGDVLERSVVRQRLKEGKAFACCNDCGKKLVLPTAGEPLRLTRAAETELLSQARVVEQRTRFEQAVFRVRAYVAERGLTPPACFVSYAWGVSEHERWVEKRLAPDLQKAGMAVVLDRWDNAQIGASVARFIERITQSDRIIMVGTPLYRRKYENKDTTTGYVVAAEVDLINNRLLGTEALKESVLPVVLAGEKTTSLPPLMHGRVHADFRDEAAYFTMTFDLILSLYHLSPNHPAVADLRESLRQPELR